MKCLKATFSRDLYKRISENRSRGHGMHWKARHDITDIGSTSFHQETALRAADELVDLAVVQVCLVCVDRHSGKPSPRMNQYHHLRNHLKDPKTIVGPDEEEVPPNAFTTETLIETPHIDFNNHVRYDRYIEFSLQNVQEAYKKGYYKGWRFDLAKAWVYELHITYHSETVLGDNIQILTWVNKSQNKDVIHSKIMNGGKFVTYMYLTLHDEKEKDPSKL